VNNFNTALSIISGLNSSAVHRLKFTRAEVPDRLWAVRSSSPPPPKAIALLGRMIKPIHVEQELEQVQQTLGGSNYSNYRERLHSVNPPVLPYLYAHSSAD
jgi:hypothetical protein